MADGSNLDMSQTLGAMRRIPMLNAFVHDIGMDDLVENFREGVMLTLHVDMMIKLQEDREFYDLLEQFDVITCDSQIMAFSTHWLGTPVRERVSGSDFFPKFYTRYANDLSTTLFLCGGRPGVADIAAEKINVKVGRKMIVGTDSPAFDFDTNPDELERMIAAINASGATVCLVALAGGRQEKFIMKHRHRMPGVKLWLPLGGTVDYESGMLPRPAPWVTDAGLEWLYRLFKEPRARFRRYLIQDPPFLWWVFKQKFGLYRDPFGKSG